MVGRLLGGEDITWSECFRTLYLWPSLAILMLRLWWRSGAQFRCVDMIRAFVLLLLIFSLFLILLGGGCLYTGNLSLPTRWEDSLRRSWTESFWRALTQYWFRTLNSFRTLVSVTSIWISIPMLFKLTSPRRWRIYI